MSISDYAELKLLGQVTGRRQWTKPSATYIGLYNVSPSDVGGGTFVTDAWMQQIRWHDPTPEGSTNLNTVIFPVASSEWGEITAWGIFDSAGGAANLLWWGDFDAPLTTVNIGQQFTIPADSLTLSLD